MLPKRINYSVIIPHKNTPDLLRRCLNSIPKREDVQIIIVDDNSDLSVVDFLNFPGNGEYQTEVYFTKEGKGAGYARNVGLTKAKGKWLVFADADDFFNESFGNQMDKYKESDADLILFTTNSVLSDSLLPVKSRGSVYNRWLEQSKMLGVVSNKLRYNFYSPCAKFISSGLVFKNNIKFEETFTANDVFFSTRTGHLGKKIKIELTSIYCATVRVGSLEKTTNMAHIKPRFEVALNQYKFLKAVGKEKYRPNIWVYMGFFRKTDKLWIQRFLVPAAKTIKIHHLAIDFFKALKFKFQRN